MAQGKFPVRGPLGKDFDNPSDSTRRALGGRPLGWKAVCIGIKGDLAEFAFLFGVPTWKSATDPCFLCSCSHHQLFEVQGFGPAGTSRPPKTHAQYEQTCSGCEIRVKVKTPAQKTELRANMEVSYKFRGRFITRDLPNFNLRKGDRLEPSAKIVDTHQWEDLELPIVLTCWGSSRRGMTHHRNPLFGGTSAISFASCICLDWLHTLSLGIFQDFIGAFVNTLIQLNVWHCPGNLEPCRRFSFCRFEADLRQFYRDERQLGVFHSQVQRLDPNLFGTSEKPLCMLHGGETNGFLAYCVKLVDKFEHQLASPQVWRRACKSLLRMRDLCTINTADWDPTAHTEER